MRYEKQCKFTPLGFETDGELLFLHFERRVNLPRWGLKRRGSREVYQIFFRCKFTPLGFETF